MCAVYESEVREGEYRQLYLNVCLASPADRREEGEEDEEEEEEGVRRVHGWRERKEETQESEGEKDYFWSRARLSAHTDFYFPALRQLASLNQ